MNEKEKNPWKTLNSEIKFETPWITVTKHDVLNPTGNPGLYGVVTFKNLAIGVLVIDNEKNTWLVGQWRYPLDQYSWEIPEGGGPLDEEPIESAKRELKEETGIVAKKYTEIARMHTSNSATTEHAILFVAQDLEFFDSEPDDTEDLKIKKLPFSEAYNMVMTGQITDSLSMVAILKAKILMDEGKL